MTWAEAMLRVSSRIETLNLDPSDLAANITDLIAQSAFERLQRLCISQHIPVTGWDCDTSARILQPPPPLLHSILLSGVIVGWTLIRLPETITSLYVSTHPFNGDSCADILDVLKRLPNLEHLHLDPLPHQAGKLSGTTNLPHLKWFTLTVNLDNDNAVDFLNCLSFPSST